MKAQPRKKIRASVEITERTDACHLKFLILCPAHPLMNCGTASGHKAIRMHSRNTVSTTCIAMFGEGGKFFGKFFLFLPKDVAMPGKKHTFLLRGGRRESVSGVRRECQYQGVQSWEFHFAKNSLRHRKSCVRLPETCAGKPHPSGRSLLPCT